MADFPGPVALATHEAPRRHPRHRQLRSVSRRLPGAAGAARHDSRTCAGWPRGGGKGSRCGSTSWCDDGAGAARPDRDRPLDAGRDGRGAAGAVLLAVSGPYPRGDRRDARVDRLDARRVCRGGARGHPSRGDAPARPAGSDPALARHGSNAAPALQRRAPGDAGHPAADRPRRPARDRDDRVPGRRPRRDVDARSDPGAAGAVGRAVVCRASPRTVTSGSTASIRSRTWRSFPAYPLLIRGVGRGDRRVRGRRARGQADRPADVVRAGIALAAFLWAAWYFGALAREMMDEPRARAALWLLAAYPFALFYSAAYTESLFLLAALGDVVPLPSRPERRHDRLGTARRPDAAQRLLPEHPAGAAGARRPRRRRSADCRGRVSWRRLALAAMPGIGMLLFTALRAPDDRHLVRVGQDACRMGAGGRRRRRRSRSSSGFGAGGLAAFAAEHPYDLLNGARAAVRAGAGPRRSGGSARPGRRSS